MKSKRYYIAFEPHLESINDAFYNYFKNNSNINFKILNKPRWKYKFKILLLIKFIYFSIKSFFEYIFVFDLVHVNSAKSGFSAYLASFFGTKYIYTIHGCPHPDIEKKKDIKIIFYV